MVEYHIPALRFTAHRIIPADDHRQAWLLCRDTVATHRHLAGGGWWEAVWRAGHAEHGVCIGRVSWRAWVLRTAAALARGESHGPCAAPRRGSFPFAVA